MRPYIIGITGGSGSGKTLFIRKIMESFDDQQVCFIAQDNYYRNRDEQPVDDQGVKNFDRPESIDIRKFVGDIKNLLAGRKVVIREYTYNNPGLEPIILEFNPAPVLLLEGIFIFHIKEIADLIDLKIFIDAREHIMLKRRIIRDEEERGYDLKDVLYRYEHHVMPAFNSYILPHKSESDIIVNNNTGFTEALKVIRTYISSLLE